MTEKIQQNNLFAALTPAKWRLLSKRKKTQRAFKILLAAALLTSIHANGQFSMVYSSCANATVVLNTTHYLGTTGSFNNNGTDDKSKAFDGDVNTYFDGPNGMTTGVWAGMDLGAVKQILCIRIRPRDGWASRMTGGVFQVANDSTFTNPRTIYTVSSNTITSFTDYYLSDFTPTGTQTRYFRYLSPDNGYGNVAEITLYGLDPGALPQPSTDWTANENTAGDKIVGKAGSTVGITVDSVGELVADSNIIAKNIYGHSFSYGYDQVIPDYVFDKDYALMPLGEVEDYVKKYKHLPDVPSDQDYKERGAIDMKEIDLLLLRKVEELTLHLIDQDKKNQKLEAENNRLRKQAKGKN